MIDFLKALLGICVHQYENVSTREIFRREIFRKDNAIIGLWRIDRCKYCNKYKENKFYV